MGRTVPSFRKALESEKEDWNPFRNALDKKERKEFDEMWDIAKLYVSACSSSVQLVPLQPIIMSILFHHYKVLLECIRQVDELGARGMFVTSSDLTETAFIKDDKGRRYKESN